MLPRAHALRLAVRGVFSGGASSAVALLSLAVGIAANSTVFSLVQAVEFPDLPYPDAPRIVFLESRHHQRGISGMLVSRPDAADLAAGSRTLERTSVAADQSSVLREAGSGRRVTGRRVTSGFFDVLGVAPAAGRRLMPADGPGVLVLSDSLWRSVFSADPRVVGRSVRLDGGQVVIVGVMPGRFDPDAEFWVPLEPPAGAARDDRQFSFFARVRPQVSLEDVGRELSEMSRRLAAEHPGTNTGWEMYPVPLARLHGRDARQSILLLQAAVGIVLLIVCANIANVLLARATDRRHEMAVRLSLGATRGRLVRTLFAETLVLSVAGAALGLLLAMWGIRASRALTGVAGVLEPALNLWVLGFTSALCLLTAVVCGLFPALQASAVAPRTALQGEARTLVGGGGDAFRSGLVVCQIALAVVLVTCGALMLRTLVNRLQVDLGFEPRGAFRADVGLPADRYSDPDAQRAAVERLLEAARAGTGVQAAGAVTWAMPTGAGGLRVLTVPGRDDDPLARSVRRSIEAVTPGYFDALGLTLRAGRDFTSADRGEAPVAIVNEEVVRQLFAGENPVGRALRLGTREEGAPVATIVGVVANVRRSPMHDAAVARVYLPYAQHPNGLPTFVVRSRDRADAAIQRFGTAVRRVDPELLVENAQTMEEDVGQFVAPVRLMTTLLGSFAVLALLLAALGVFGAMSYSVSRRRRELAIRSALGASRHDLLRLVLGRALVITAVGIGAGAIAASLATQAIAGMVFGVSRLDPPTFAAASLLLAAVALLSCYRPARRGASADPATLLRA